MDKKFRSSCIIASALDLIGDKWSLLIVRDMLLFHKKTFKQIAASDEGVATNLLSGRLKLLESLDIISKRKLPENKKENVYLLSEKGIALAPLIMEIVVWSDKHVRPYHPEMNPHDSGNANKSLQTINVQNDYRKFMLALLGYGNGEKRP